MKNQPRQLGFTLLETIIAMTMIVLIVTVVYATYRATLAGATYSQAKLTTSRHARSLIAQLTRQLQYACDNPTQSQKEADTLLKKNDLTQSEAPFEFDRLGKRLSLRFITACPLALPTAIGTLYEVEYQCQSDSTLRYRQKPISQNEKSFTKTTTDWRKLPFDNLTLNLEFYDGQTWLDHWDTDNKNTLPRAVKIKLTPSQNAAVQTEYQTTAYLYATRFDQPQNQTPSPLKTAQISSSDQWQVHP